VDLHYRLDILVLCKPLYVLASVRLLESLPLPSRVRHQAAGRAHSSGLVPVGGMVIWIQLELDFGNPLVATASPRKSRRVETIQGCRQIGGLIFVNIEMINVMRFMQQADDETGEQSNKLSASNKNIYIYYNNKQQCRISCTLCCILSV
jgi:hypothetical protein